MEHATSPEAQYEKTVNELEADIVERVREALGGGESWGAILQRAGIDPNSRFARDFAGVVGREEPPPEPARGRSTWDLAFNDLPIYADTKAPPSLFDDFDKTARGNAAELSPEEAALVARTNEAEPYRVVVADTDDLNAGL